MKLFQNIIKLSYILGIIFIGQNVFGQTPKEIDIALKFAPIFDIKICDSYTLSYFINETDENGTTVYNNGLLSQTANNKVTKKSFYNQRTTLDILMKFGQLVKQHF